MTPIKQLSNSSGSQPTIEQPGANILRGPASGHYFSVDAHTVARMNQLYCGTVTLTQLYINS